LTKNQPSQWRTVARIIQETMREEDVLS
jgi:hypothetical protein